MSNKYVLLEYCFYRHRDFVYIQSLLAARAVWLNLGPNLGSLRACGPQATVVGRDAAKLPRLPGEIVFIIMEPTLDSNR